MKKLQLTLEADGGPTSTNGILLPLPYIAVANYNVQHKNMSYEYDRKELIRESAKGVGIKYLLSTGQQLPTDSIRKSAKGVVIESVRLLNWLCSKLGYFSQSTACITTRFRECSLTLLDKLWYLYSYIYKPTTIHYGISIFLNS